MMRLNKKHRASESFGASVQFWYHAMKK